MDGCPAGLPLSEEDIQPELDKRRPGTGIISTSRKERDKVKIISGVFKGFTTGAPICMIIKNLDIDSKPYEETRYTPRPGHADYTAYIKYRGFNDYRGGGRFSGRITATYVMAGAVAKKLLKMFNVEILAHTIQIGRIRLEEEVSLEDIRRNVYQNKVRCADPKTANLMEKEILEASEKGDSLGGIIEGIALNVPPGIGDPIFDSLDSDLAKMLFNIPAVKGVEFGAGFKSASLRGSQNNDQFCIKNGKIVTSTNNSGGILGGLSTGMPIVVKIAFKPTPSIKIKQKTVDLRCMKEVELEVKGRHDPCIVPRAVPVVESCIALVIADHMIRAGIIPNVLQSKRNI